MSVNKSIFLIILTILFFIFFYCGINNNPEVGKTTNSGCKPDGDQTKEESIPEEYFEYEVNGNDVTIYHYNAYESCGMEFEFLTSMDGNTITITEKRETDLQTGCTCPYDFSIELLDLLAGNYIVIIKNHEGDKLGEIEITV